MNIKSLLIATGAVMLLAQPVLACKTHSYAPGTTLPTSVSADNACLASIVKKNEKHGVTVVSVENKVSVVTGHRLHIVTFSNGTYAGVYGNGRILKSPTPIFAWSFGK